MKENKITSSSFLKSILKFSVSSWINFIIGIVAVIITTRVFTPDLYGILNIFNTTSLVFVGVATVGLDGAFLRFFNEPPKGWDKKSLFAKCLSLSVFFLIVVSIVVIFFFYSNISFLLFNKISLYLTVLLSVNALSLLVLNNYYLQFYRLDNDSFHYTIQSVVIHFFSKLFVVFAAFLSPTAEVVLTVNTIGIFIVMIVYSLIQRKTVFPNHYQWSNHNFNEVYRYALYSWPLTFALPLCTFLIPFVIKMKLDVYSLGVFSSASFFVSAFNVIQSGFRTYWAAFMFAHYKTEQATITRIHNYVIIFVIGLLGIFIIFQHVIYMLIGSEFHGSRLFFSLILIDPLLLLLEQTTNYGMSISKKNHQFTAIYILCIAINVLCTYYLVVIFGLIGAAMSSAIAATVRFTLSTWRGQTYYKSIGNIFVTVAGVILLILLGVSNCLFSQQYLVEVGVVLGVFACTFLLFRHNFKEIQQFVRSAL